jgi:predicted DCC family thiol-disulfide oxidoreductase YuxK
MKRCYVFYDGECALCRRCREWLASQPSYVELVFHPFQSAEARRLCPELPRFQPTEQLIVLSDEGGVYAGESAWLMCLYALRDYRGWARKLSAPALRPLAHRICILVSHHRLQLSRTLLHLSGHVLESAVANSAKDHGNWCRYDQADHDPNGGGAK